jgi:hypothetical protein
MEDITKYKFSDPNHDATEVDGEDVWLYLSNHTDMPNLLDITFNRGDIIALAKHYNIKQQELEAER